MAFNPLMTLLTGSVRNLLPEGPRVIELGNQSFRTSDDALGAVRSRLSSHQHVDGSVLESFLGLSKEERIPKTEAFYRALGFTDYKAIDVNDKFGSLVMDLNKELDGEYGFHDQFDLVTNNGTSEHVFNQYTVFKNCHNMCKPGGVMIHCLPFELYVNHGFYSYHPGLFVDLASANKYEVKALGFANRQGEGAISSPAKGGEDAPGLIKPVLLVERTIALSAMLGRPDLRTTTLRGRIWNIARSIARGVLKNKVEKPLSRELASALNSASNHRTTRKLMVFAILRKTSDDPFAVPIQGLYAGDNITDETIKNRYAA